MFLRSFGAAAHVLLAGLLADHAQATVIRGVNLGGWLVAEEWMSPTLFNSSGKHQPDEWNLCNALGKTKCKETLEKHWQTWITRDDIVEIKNAGLRHNADNADFIIPDSIRVPVGYWAVDLLDYEPYVQGQYPYLIQAVTWAKELGLTVFIDIHGAPGSQNGWGLSGLVGPVDFLANQTNAERTLNVLKNLTTEFMKSEYGGVVTNIQPLNEPTITYDELRKFYTPAADVVGAANSSGINLTISDGFFKPHSWQTYNPWDWHASKPAEHITLDTHQFWAFEPLVHLPKPDILKAICQFAQVELRSPAVQGTPPTLVGEWSLSSGITANSTVDASQDRDKRTWFRLLFEAQNAAFSPNTTGQASIGWYFWTWKTEYDTDAWSYRKGIQQQYIPSNVSDPSTYAFPIIDGCVDDTHNWTAPELPSTTSSGAANPANNAASPATPSKTGAGFQLKPQSITNAAFVLLVVVMFGSFC